MVVQDVRSIFAPAKWIFTPSLALATALTAWILSQSIYKHIFTAFCQPSNRTLDKDQGSSQLFSAKSLDAVGQQQMRWLKLKLTRQPKSFIARQRLKHIQYSRYQFLDQRPLAVAGLAVDVACIAGIMKRQTPLMTELFGLAESHPGIVLAGYQ